MPGIFVADKRLPHLPTAATRSAPLTPPQAAVASLPKLSHIRLYIIVINERQKAGALPVAVPGIFVADGAASSSADRSHSLPSLHLPQAALGSLPKLSHIRLYISQAVLYTRNLENATAK